MKNKEKYAKEIVDIVCDGGRVAVKNGKPQHCDTLTCGKCDLRKSGEGCRKEFKKWCNEEYGEPQIDWSKVPIDTPIKVKNSKKDVWNNGHFAKYQDGKVWTFWNGATSWSNISVLNSWNFAEIADMNNLRKKSIFRTDRSEEE